MLRNLVCLIYSFFSLISVVAQSSHYRIFENIPLGVDASVVNSFTQDRQGMMWIGTDKGLFSYDGYSLQPHFTYGERNNSRIYCSIIVGENYLYLGSDNGLLVYNYYTDTYETPDIAFPADIRAMVCREDTLWIGTLNGLFTYNLRSRQLNRVDRGKHGGLPHETVYSLIHSSDDRIYIGTYDGLSCYYPESDVFQTVPLPVATNKSNLFVNSLLEDTVRNCIWIGTEGNLFKFDPSEMMVERLHFFHDNSVKTLALDQQENLLIGTDNGLYIYQQGGELQHIVHDSRNSSSLSNNIVWAIFTDKEKNIWVGTDYGISLSRFSDGFYFVPVSQVTGTGEGNHFYSLFKDSRGYYWFGGTNGLIRFRSVTGQKSESIWYKMGSERAPLSHNRVRNIYEDKDRNLWIATDGSIHRYDYKTEQFIHYNIVDSSGTYNCNWAYSLFEDSEGYLWIASFLGGVFVVDKQKLLHTQTGNYVADAHYSVSNGLPGMFVNQLIPDHQGNIWMLLYNNGVTKINVYTRKIIKVPVVGVPGSDSLNYILCDDSGVIWAGFRYGVMRFLPGKQTPDIIPLESFGHNGILSMIEVEQDIWVSTTDGLWVIQRETLDTRRVNIIDRDFTSMFYDPIDRLVYMGSVDGFVVTSPEMAYKNKNENPLVVTALYINNRIVTPEEGINEGSIRYARQLKLNHTQNNLAFEISDLSYSLDEKPQFMYKLTSIDQDWNLLKQNTNRITYHNLRYGNYQLMISELDAHGKPSAYLYTMDIRINPPWYYTSWAKAFYLFLILTLILWIINFFRVRSRLKFERIEKEKILEQSQSKIDFFTHVSHDFKTPLSLIIAPVSKLLLEVRNPLEKKQLEIIQHNAKKLNSLIHQVLDFNRIEDSVGAVLILSKVEFISFAKSLLSVYEEEVVKEKRVTFLFESNLQELYLDIDVLKFESILENLLSNAFKYTSEGGEVTLSVYISDVSGELEIMVSDNGMGVPEKDIPYIFQRFFQSSNTSGKKEGTGIGLYLVKSYTELHGGVINVVSQEGQGTSIRLVFPRMLKQDPSDFLHDEEQPQIDRDDKPLILIVDDSADIAALICEILQPNYRCRVAENGKAGFELCTQILPDLVIADVMMPVMSGLEMCQRIKRNIPTSTIPIILLTAKNDRETELESIYLHIDAFIGKPFEPKILLSRVQQLLLSKQQMEAKARIEVISTPKAIEAISSDEKFLSKLTAIIEDYVSDSSLNVNRLSELSGIHHKQIYRKIKQLTGMSPVEYIKSIRMKKAAMLLRQKKFTVAEVMYMVGYSNHSYFSKCFQSEFEKTPRQFMEES